MLWAWIRFTRYSISLLISTYRIFPEVMGENCNENKPEIQRDSQHSKPGKQVILKGEVSRVQQRVRGKPNEVDEHQVEYNEVRLQRVVHNVKIEDLYFEISGNHKVD